MRPPIRLAALSHVPVIYVFSHDSIGLGEDGPTHQPIEQLAALRAIPNLVLIRPADATETVEAWRMAILSRNGPVALVLTRQKVPVIDRAKYAPANGLRLGGYVLADEAAAPQPWYRWVGDHGAVLGIERFGASAPYQRIYEEFGLTVENVVRRAKELLRA